MAGGPHALTVPIDWGSPQAESPPQCPTSGAHWIEMAKNAERGWNLSRVLEKWSRAIGVGSEFPVEWAR